MRRHGVGHRGTRVEARPVRRTRHRLIIAATLGCVVLVWATAAGAQIEPVDDLVRDRDPVRPATTTTTQTGDELKGLFGVEEGQCADEGVTSGSYFRMVQPGGDVENGPFVGNGDSSCGDDTYTPLRPGIDGGLSTTAYQPHPDPAFEGGHGVNDKIIQPQSFFGTRFAGATNETDPQTDTQVPLPQVLVSGGSLSGNLSAYAAAWNGQHFNQGSPKPDGSKPGNTSGPTGTYDEGSGRYTLTWSSQIVGGPFNNFTGIWHFEGTFEGQRTAAATGGGGTGGGTGGDTTSTGGANPAPAAVSGGSTGTSGAPTTTSGEATPRTGASSVPPGLVLVGLAGALRFAAGRGRRRGA